MSSGRLDGKVAIITGASTGLGPVMASMFVREGARVLLAARREELVQEAAANAGAGAIAMRADVTNEDDVEAMVSRAVDEFGQVDIMCNNAAAPGTDLWIWEQTLENWNATIAIDVTAAMLCTREVLNQSMLERRSGVILNFSSTAGYNGIVRKSHYVTAKASLRAFTKAVALEVGQYGIRCNCVVPGGIDTELWRNWVQRTADEQGRRLREPSCADAPECGAARHLLTRGRRQPGVVPGQRREPDDHRAVDSRRRRRPTCRAEVTAPSDLVRPRCDASG